jgi:hypothetical protein
MRILLECRARLYVLSLICMWCFSLAQAADTGTEVTLWLESGQIVASSQLSGRRELPLGAQEIVMSSGVNGINGLVVTSRRLLGFSSRTLTWTKKELDVNEKVLERKILPTFSLIRTDRRLYGFRGVNGLWLEEALGVREKVQRFHSNDYGAVFITNERLIGFNPLLGGFASKLLDVHEQIVGVHHQTNAGLRQPLEWVGRVRMNRDSLLEACETPSSAFELLPPCNVPLTPT